MGLSFPTIAGYGDHGAIVTIRPMRSQHIL